MKNTIRRFISMVMLIAMMLSIAMPTAAFATEDSESQVTENTAIVDSNIDTVDETASGEASSEQPALADSFDGAESEAASESVDGTDAENEPVTTLDSTVKGEDEGEQQAEEAADEGTLTFSVDDIADFSDEVSEGTVGTMLLSASRSAADYTFTNATAKLSDILSAASISLGSNKYSVSVDNAAVTLSSSEVKSKDLGSFTLTANEYFDLATLTMVSNNGHESYSIKLSYPAPQTEDEDDGLKEYVVNDPLRAEVPEDAIWANEDLYLTGKMPKKGIVVATPVEVEMDGTVLAAYDIKIYVNENQLRKGKTWQPASDKVTVHMRNEAFKGLESVDVYHIADGSKTQDYVATVTPGADGGISFDAKSFSVYVVIDHEGETVVTPRVEFHFIDRLSDNDYKNGASSPFTTAPYNFVNKAGNYQTTQILKNGETLELINDPRNIKFDNDDGTTSEKFFYGWYVVNMTDDTSALDTDTESSTYGRYIGSISYTWPDSMKIDFSKALSITTTDSDGNGSINVGDTLDWELGEANGSGTIDADGSVHVYLAPLFQDFYFVNFRMGAKEDSGLSNNLLTRKLIVFGEQDSTTVRIGDVECPSGDPQHQIFVGWETVTDNGGLVRDQYYQTIDSDGNEINNPASGTGYYITLTKSGSDVTQMDFYPVFAEARWMYFKRGASGNGSSYVGAAYRLTNDENEGTYFDNDFFNGTNGNVRHLSTRPGYKLEGWYAFAVTDNDGNITNLTTPADVEISYIDEAGEKQTATVNTTAIKIVAVDNTGSSPVGSIVYSGTYNLSVDGSNVKLFEVVDGKIYVYKALDDLTLYANWKKDEETTIRVIIWKQKVTDDVNAADADKTYDYEIFYTKTDASTSALPSLTSFSGSCVDKDSNTRTENNLNLTNLANSTPSYLSSFTGFHYARNDVSTVGNPEPDGTTVYNVYYDRDVHRLTFQVDDSNSGYNYTVTTSNSGTQYAFINGEFVQLSYTNGTWYAPEYGDVYTQDDTNGTYGKVGDKYYELTPVYEQTTTYTANYRYSSATNNSGTQYGIVDGEYTSITRSGGYYYYTSYTISNETYSGYYYIPNETGEYTRVYLYRNDGRWYRERNYNYGWQYSNEYVGNVYEQTSLRYQGTRYTRDTNNLPDVTNDSSLNTTELYYIDGNGGKVPVTANTITTITGYTYVDDSGVTQTYTGQHRYTKSYARTGNNVEFNGTRYTRSNLTSSWYTVYIIEALYGQNIANHFPIIGANGTNYSGYVWTPQNSNVFTSGDVGYIDTMQNESTTFRVKQYGTRTQNHIYYYVETLPGENGNVTFDGKQFNELQHLIIISDGGIESTESEEFSDINGFTQYKSNPAYSNGRVSLNQSNNYTIKLYYTRNQYNLTFDVNYPVDANLVYSNGKSTNLTVNSIYYQASLKQYGSSVVDGKTHWYYGIVDDSNTAENELVGPDHYIFGGWYEDASCTVRFNFNNTMPVGNKIVYAKWTPERFIIKIDPNGGEIDHVNHNGYSSFGSGTVTVNGQQYTYDFTTVNSAYSQYPLPSTSNYNESFQTYIRSSYGTTLTIYEPVRRFVALSDAAAQSYNGPVYYYVNYQWRSTDGASGIHNDVRSALYLTESELQSFYDLYRNIVIYSVGGFASSNQGMTLLDYDTWKSVYVSSTKYRPLSSNEHWTFLGWYKVVDGVMADMPYNVSDPVTEPFTLKAMWRLDGGYTVHYIAEYTMDDGSVINGGMEKWTDPNATNLAYSDGATTTIYKAPTELTRNGTTITDDSVIFLGFRLANNTGTAENPVFEAAEVDGEGNVTTYYYPGDIYTILAANADQDGNIYLQAVYQDKEASHRRPTVTNLAIDANTGYVNTSNSSTLPAWVYPGVQAINTENHLDASNRPTQILYGDIQSSAALHLYKYATELTHDGVTGKNFFTHPDGYFLLGFDDSATEGDYVATYAADSVIAVDRNDNRTIYAVWEPMVYVTFVNNTGVGNVTFSISATNSEVLEVINVKNGMYDRTPLTNLSEITLPKGESMTLAFPKGAEKDITVSGTNTLGVGKVLIWDSSINLIVGETTSSYNTNGSSTETVSYSHSVNGGTHSHSLAKGEVSNTKAFSFDESLIANPEPLVVTFTSRNNDYALLLDDNYTGGGMQEIDYGLADIQPENGTPKTQLLPTTSTRIGYSFIGWAYSKTATAPDFSASKPDGSPWTITDLNRDDGFFSTGTVTVDDVITRTLYAVWEAKTDAVYVYKEVPEPGNQEQAFEFTVAITGSYKYGSGNGNTETVNTSGTFTIKHGEYLKIISTNFNPTSGTNQTAFVQSVVEVYTPVTNQDGTTSYQKVDGRGATVRWQKTGVKGSNSNGFSNLRITVTETQVSYYDTSVTLSSQKNERSLTIGSSNYSNNALPKTVSANTFYWTNTDDGGTVVFTNQRQAFNVDVSKVLTANTTASTIFNYSASYVDSYVNLSGETVTITKNLDDFQVTSGSKTTLENLPAGVQLTVTENTDANDNYKTFVSVDGGAETTGKSSGAFAVGQSPADATNKTHTVAYRNVLKSYPVTFILVDQDGNTSINGMFSLSSSIGTLGSDLYASSTSTNPPAGVFYTSSQFWADTYTLTQTVIPTHYIGVTVPVTLKVTGNGITSDHPDVTVTMVTEGVPEDGYVITVKNRATKTITVKKVLSDPLLTSTRTFAFSYSYTPQGETTPVSGHFTLAPVSNAASGVTYELTVPIRASVTITELTSGAYSSVSDTYDTTIDSTDYTDENTGDGAVFTVSSVENDGTVTFTNERKTVEITVKKIVKGDASSGDFEFTATLTGNNGNPVKLSNVLGAVGTDEQGKIEFTLGHNQSVTLRIPKYSNLLVTETEDSQYKTKVQTGTSESTLGSSANSSEVTFNSVSENEFILFTNAKKLPAATGLNFRIAPFALILIAGVVIRMIYILRKRREDDDDDDGDDDNPGGGRGTIPPTVKEEECSPQHDNPPGTGASEASENRLRAWTLRHHDGWAKHRAAAAEIGRRAREKILSRVILTRIRGWPEKNI